MIYHVNSPAIALKKQHRDDKMHTLYIIHPFDRAVSASDLVDDPMDSAPVMNITYQISGKV